MLDAFACKVCKFCELKYLRLMLFLKGIRFYKTDLVPQNEEFRKATFNLNTGEVLEFYFYKELVEDLVYKRGVIKKKHYTGYVIQARFSDGLPESLRQYNNLKFFFDNERWYFKDEEALTNLLLNIFVDFILEEMKELKA